MSEASNLLQERPDERHVAVALPDDVERVRSLIRIELDRQHARPVARRTLELLAESAVEPAEGAPGYRILDRNGETRLKPPSPEPPKKGANRKGEPKADEAQGEQAGPTFTLTDLIGELRERHPDLFGEAPPPPPPPAPPSEEHAALHETVAHVTAAGARFVETQSIFARGVATRSAERGRAFAEAASGAVAGWRTRLDERLKAYRAPDPASPSSAEQGAGTVPAPSARFESTMARRDWRSFGRDAVSRLRLGSTRFGEGIGSRPAPQAAAAAPTASPSAAPKEERAGSRNAIGLGIGGVAAVVLVAGLVSLARRDASAPSTPEPAQRPAPSRQVEPAPQSQAPSSAPKQPVPQEPALPATNPAPSNQPTDAEEQPDEAQPRNPGEVAGVPEVVDTATLKLGGKVVRLFGVEWVRGGQADELTKYLAKRPVTCQPAPGSSAYFCMVNGRDLSEVVLFNGGGRASSEAGPELIAAEDHARSERLGVWKR